MNFKPKIETVPKVVLKSNAPKIGFTGAIVASPSPISFMGSKPNSKLQTIDAGKCTFFSYHY